MSGATGSATPNVGLSSNRSNSSGTPSAPPRPASYGAAIPAATSGNFPAIGSTLGPYFSVGRLGFGTFCSIHKCINLGYHHNKKRKTFENDKRKALRLVAAKVEIGEFKNSGVLGGEASILHFLDESLPPNTVPTYMGHYVNSNRDREQNKTVTSAIVMEYLTGQDMHKIREWSTKHQEQQQQEKHERAERGDDEDEAQFSPESYGVGKNKGNEHGSPTKGSSATNNRNKGSGASTRRRIAIKDAVYLTAHVLLPLLRKMHSVGIIHRDVKPSNVVKRNDDGDEDESNSGSNADMFCIVDFGLSKSIVVPHTNDTADAKQSWKGSTWMGASAPGTAVSSRDPSGFELLSPDSSGPTEGKTNNRPCYRAERPTADFRGTSMYASVRVHQLREYSPRDDIWSLLYVFCDLASGGLPWMLYAANRDRAACKLLKERIHGLEPHADGRIGTDTKRLLLGDEYHRALFRKRNGRVDPPMDHEEGALIEDEEDPDLPKPLALSEDVHKVGLLTKAFEHLKGLGYADIPDYDLIRGCLEGFREDGNKQSTNGSEAGNGSCETPIPCIDWGLLAEHSRSTENAGHGNGHGSVPAWGFLDGNKGDNDPLDASVFAEAESGILRGNNGEEEGGPLYGEAADMARLPLELRFRMAQMDYNTAHHTTIEPHLALRDWLAACLLLLHTPWDSKRYERGGHRSSGDGYKREFFLRLVNKCLGGAARFGGFRARGVIYRGGGDENENNHNNNGSSSERPAKRRKVGMRNVHEPPGNETADLLLLSRVLFELRHTKKLEEKLSPPPPSRLSFGS